MTDVTLSETTNPFAAWARLASHAGSLWLRSGSRNAKSPLRIR